jgi:hypothetical protein
MALIHTTAHRKALLQAADAELRLEGLHRSEATKPIFAALVAGRITSSQVVLALNNHYSPVLVRRGQSHGDTYLKNTGIDHDRRHT